MRVILVGGGEIVFFLARAYIGRGDNVSIINADRDECEHLSRKLNAVVIKGDATDPDILEDALARQAQAIIAVTPFVLVSELEEEVENDQIYDLLNYNNESAFVGEVTISDSMPSCGKSIGELDLPSDASVVGVVRNNMFNFSKKEWTIQDKDKVLVLTVPNSHGKSMAALCGEDR
jgi:trk system potassium uptake protein TrkA